MDVDDQLSHAIQALPRDAVGNLCADTMLAAKDEIRRLRRALDWLLTDQDTAMLIARARAKGRTEVAATLETIANDLDGKGP